jgi:hypothetical protein
MDELYNAIYFLREKNHDEMAPEDIKGWEDGEITLDNLAAFARSLEQHQEMAESRVPAHYDQVATCKRCGPGLVLVFRGV